MVKDFSLVQWVPFKVKHVYSAMGYHTVCGRALAYSIMDIHIVHGRTLVHSIILSC